MKKKDFYSLIKKVPLMLDGSTGTALAARGMPAGVCPEKWIMENSSILTALQKEYISAGSRIIYAPTFGGNRIKLAEFGLEENLKNINIALVRASREAAGKRAFVFGDLSPTGKFIEPFGPMPFEEAISVFREQALCLIEAGVDGFVIETMLDIQEARAALIAVRESCELPVMVSMTFETTGHTLNGTDPLSALMTLQTLGADAVGCNCSTGPDSMIEIIKKMKPSASVPLIAKPNAGMPSLKNGKTVFSMGPEEFAMHGKRLIEAGANIIGGCCGTGPEYIKMLCRGTAGLKTIPPLPKIPPALCSSRRTVMLEPSSPLVIVGERINPTGKAALKEELKQGKMSLVLKFASEQEEAGARILDVNMGMPGINEQEMMIKAVKKLCLSSALPLCIDSTSPGTVEAALRLYPGRALINSISAEKERIEKILPLAARYGAMFIVLPLTDEGIPATFEKRSQTAMKILAEAAKLGLGAESAVLDALVMTISSDTAAAQTALKLIEWGSKELKINTICGLSNVSFGMPERQLINATFLAMAADRGLSMAIANPSSGFLMDVKYASDLIAGKDSRLSNYISRFTGKTDTAAGDGRSPGRELTAGEKIRTAVLRGEKDLMPKLIQDALGQGESASAIVDKFLIPAINEVGDKFDRKEYFLPQLVLSADAMRTGFEQLEPLLLRDNPSASSGPVVVMATVQGDIHDIGKNIVCLMLKNYGFRVIDIGKDARPEFIIEEAARNKADIVGLSALMTTTMIKMKEVISLSKKQNRPFKFMIGGAVVDKAYADEIGADGYAGDAMEAVKIARALCGL